MVRNRNNTGLTLVELIAASAVLIIMISIIGYIFRASSRTVETARSLMDSNAAAQVVATRLHRDLEGLTKDGFLCVVERTLDRGPGGTPTPTALIFTATGRFTSATSPGYMSNSALIAYMRAVDNSAPGGEPTILGRYRYLLTGNGQLHDPAVDDWLGSSLADIVGVTGAGFVLDDFRSII